MIRLLTMATALFFTGLAIAQSFRGSALPSLGKLYSVRHR